MIQLPWSVGELEEEKGAMIWSPGLMLLFDLGGFVDKVSINQSLMTVKEAVQILRECLVLQGCID